MPLPNDISRCAEKDCPKAKQCARFTDKGTGQNISQTASLRDNANACYSFIQVVK